ncbi:hypothetical protein [Sporosarcina sp. FSL K6-3457]|uniref:hypothetical protein n=1 Tax=Sporosarcina sp. FSL K6-3457 TaxID=2978204 RepID=UPI0030F92D1B
MNREQQQSKRKVEPFNSYPSTQSSLPNLVVTPSDAKRRIDDLNVFVQNSMVKGIDYGMISGFSKPTLLKPGAEKLCDAFGFSKTVDVVNRIEQWEVGVFAYEVKMTLTRKDNGIIEAEGLGSCNSKEAAYRHQDAFTIVNTVLKMAKKRALIDAILSATRASGLFTQDIEDFPKQTNIKGGEEQSTKFQLQTIYHLVSEISISNGEAKELMMILYNVEHSTKLSKKQAHNFIQDLLLLQNSRKKG